MDVHLSAWWLRSHSLSSLITLFCVMEPNGSCIVTNCVSLFCDDVSLVCCVVAWVELSECDGFVV